MVEMISMLATKANSPRLGFPQDLKTSWRNDRISVWTSGAMKEKKTIQIQATCSVSSSEPYLARSRSTSKSLVASGMSLSELQNLRVRWSLGEIWKRGEKVAEVREVRLFSLIKEAESKEIQSRQGA